MIGGQFKIELAGQERTMVANFAFIEMVEIQVIKKPISQLVNEAISGNFAVSNLIDVIVCGLKANKDSRLGRAEIGDEIIKRGVVNFVKTYIEILTFAITGETEPKLTESTEEGAKK